jgi:adenylate kinase
MFGLKDRFQFHLIDATGNLETVRHVILHEFEYQSSLELDQDTHDALQTLPLATDVGKHARQDLVRRLDGYQFKHRDMFRCVCVCVCVCACVCVAHWRMHLASLPRPC